MATLHRVVKDDNVSPFVNHRLAIQGDKAQHRSCAHDLAKLDITKPPEHDNLD